MEMLDYLMIICATWYISFCLVTLPGPYGIFAEMRSWQMFAIMKCIYCLSFWVGLILYGFVLAGQTDIVNIFGLVGASHLLASWTGANFGSTDSG